jgi:hypothetical protein
MLFKLIFSLFKLILHNGEDSLIVVCFNQMHMHIWIKISLGPDNPDIASEEGMTP